MAPGMCAPPNSPEGAYPERVRQGARLARLNILGEEAGRNGEVGERGAGAVDLRIQREVAGALGELAGEQAARILARFRLESEVGDALLADGGTALRTHLAAAQGAGAMGGVDLHGIGQGEELGVEAVVEQAGELLRSVIGREIGTAHVADEERVAGEDGVGVGRALRVGDQDGDALEGVAGGFEEAQNAVAEADLIAIATGTCGNFAPACAQIDGGRR